METIDINQIHAMLIKFSKKMEFQKIKSSTWLMMTLQTVLYNPYPGQIFNKPTVAGTPGEDVYAGCKIDYKGSKTTA